MSAVKAPQIAKNDKTSTLSANWRRQYWTATTTAVRTRVQMMVLRSTAALLPLQTGAMTIEFNAHDAQ
jgi:hypothetical protein